MRHLHVQGARLRCTAYGVSLERRVTNEHFLAGIGSPPNLVLGPLTKVRRVHVGPGLWPASGGANWLHFAEVTSTWLPAHCE